jgi:hypothetical protein
MIGWSVEMLKKNQRISSTLVASFGLERLRWDGRRRPELVPPGDRRIGGALGFEDAHFASKMLTF